HRRDREGQDDPGRRPGRREQSGEAEREGDAHGHAPVVADDEVPPEGPQAAHASASLRRRSAVTYPSETRITNASTNGRAASSPGQSTPAPSAPQKVPKVVSITPTAKASVFSGTRLSGPRTTMPAMTTSTIAATAPTIASGMLPCVLPNVSTMNATSRPSSSTPLKETVKPYQSRPARSSRGAVRASAASWAKIAVSSCSAL